MKLLGSTKSKITKKNAENVLHLEITEAVLERLILLITITKKLQESCIHLFLINCLANY